VATKADIEINVKGLKKVQELSKLLDKVSGKVNQLNKGGGAASEKKNNKLERESLNLQEKKRASMIRVRSVGDQIAKAKAQGLNVDKASRAIDRAALANAKGKFKVAKAQTEKALLELKTQQGISRELTQQKILRRSGSRGGFMPTGGAGGAGGGAFTSALISGAFPLLFGQGPLAAAGGFVGGFAGDKLGGKMGGFAGGLVGTSIATGIQSLITNIEQFGGALDPVRGNAAQAVQSLGFLSSARAKEIQIIEQTIGKQAALNAARQELVAVVGTQQTRDLIEASRTIKETQNRIQENFKKVMANVAKFFSDITTGGMVQTGFVNEGIIANPTDERVTQLIQAEKALEKLNLQGLDSRLEGFVETKPGSFLGSDTRFTDKGKEEVKRLRNLIKELRSEVASLGVDAKIGNIVKDINVDFQEQIDIRKSAQKLEADILALRKDGVNPAIAKELALLNKVNKDTISGLEAELKLRTDNLVNITDPTKQDLEKQALDRLDERIQKLKDSNKAQIDGIKATMLANIEAKKLNETFQKLNETIRNDIKEGIKGLIKGTSTLGDLLNNVADRFLDLALNQALFGSASGTFKKGGGGGIFGAIAGMFANGGRPPVGRPSIVGEKGPELFVPRSSGTIVPNNKLGGGGSTSVVVNVDASGSDVQGDDSGAKELGTLISVAVQGELIKQQRPGGLLASIR